MKAVRNVMRETRYGLVLGALNEPHLLALAYGSTDKATHRYMQYYARHFGHKRFQKNLVMEIGVGGADFAQPSPGGSLRIWRDYLPRSDIIGIDIHPKDVNLGPRVHFQLADQSSPGDLRRVIDSFGVPNLVIDDGSHLGDDQMASFRFLFPLMPPHSIYVIEDLSTSYYPDYDGGLPAPATSGIGFLRHLIDSVQAGDPYFSVHPQLGPGPAPDIEALGAIHVYPGIAFIEKSSSVLSG